jgi:hypothetical protein
MRRALRHPHRRMNRERPTAVLFSCLFSCLPTTVSLSMHAFFRIFLRGPQVCYTGSTEASVISD